MSDTTVDEASVWSSRLADQWAGGGGRGWHQARLSARWSRREHSRADDCANGHDSWPPGDEGPMDREHSRADDLDACARGDGGCSPGGESPMDRAAAAMP